MVASDVFIIGIAGASGCGKTYFANMLKEKVGSSGVEGIEIISCDNYYKPYPGGMKAPDDFNWDVPEVLELDLLERQLRDLKGGLTINVPKYDFLTSQRFAEPDKVVDGSKVRVVIVEGLFVLKIESLRSLFNLKLFTWLDADICLARRLVRDVKERGYSYEHTIHQYQTQVKPTYVNYIEPTKKYADLIISSSEYTDNKVGLDVICSYIKKATKM